MPDTSIGISPEDWATFSASNKDMTADTITAPFQAPSLGTNFLNNPRIIMTTDIGKIMVKIGPEIVSTLLTPVEDTRKMAMVITREASL